MNQIEISVGKKQFFSDTRLTMAFETAFHEPPVALKRSGNQVLIFTQLPLKRYHVFQFGSCLGLRIKKISENHAEIR